MLACPSPSAGVKVGGLSCFRGGPLDPKSAGRFVGGAVIRAPPFSAPKGFLPRCGLCGFLPMRYGQNGHQKVVQRRSSAALPSKHSMHALRMSLCRCAASTDALKQSPPMMRVKRGDHSSRAHRRVTSSSQHCRIDLHRIETLALLPPAFRCSDRQGHAADRRCWRHRRASFFAALAGVPCS